MVDVRGRSRRLVQTIRGCARRFRSRPEEPDADARRLHARWRTQLARSRSRLETARRNLDAALAARDHGRVRRCTDRLNNELQAVRSLETLAAAGRESNGTASFVFSSAMLRDAYLRCVETPEEGMCLILGIHVDDRYLATHVVGFPYEYRSVVGAAGRHEATHRICIQAREWQHEVLSLTHSHPGDGADSTFPSPTDLRTHQRWELGWTMIGGIWSRDGFLRFFSHQQRFEVEVVGANMRRIERNVWKLDATDASEMPEAEDIGTGVGAPGADS